MADQRLITLYPGDASPKDIILRPLAVRDVLTTTIYLYAGDATPANIVLSDPKVQRHTGGAQDATAPTVSATWTYSAPVVTPQISANTTAPTVSANLTYAAPVVTPIIQIDANAPTVSAAVTYLAQSSTPSISANATAPAINAGLTFTASSQVPVISGDATAPSVFAAFAWQAFGGEVGIYLPPIEPGIFSDYSPPAAGPVYSPKRRPRLRSPASPVARDVTAPTVFGSFRFGAHSSAPASIQLHRTRSASVRHHRDSLPAIPLAVLIRSKPTFLPLIRS